MATNTTNFNLKKPAYTDTADIADINGNMDKVDASLNGLADAIAIVAKNNTHAAITAGQYVYVHGHGSLAEGLYTAKSNIAANATLSTSNLQADGSGGLNALNSNLNSLIPQKTIKESSAVTSRTLNIGSGVRATIDYITNQPTRCLSIIVTTDGSGTVYVLEKVKGSDASYDRTANNKLKITTSDARQGWFFIMTDTKTNLDTITIV